MSVVILIKFQLYLQQELRTMFSIKHLFPHIIGEHTVQRTHKITSTLLLIPSKTSISSINNIDNNPFINVVCYLKLFELSDLAAAVWCINESQTCQNNNYKFTHFKRHINDKVHTTFPTITLFGSKYSHACLVIIMTSQSIKKHFVLNNIHLDIDCG